MLADVIEFVKSRAGNPSRDVALREINFAWKELWNLDDMPNSIFEISAQPSDSSLRITLPHFVGRIRGVKSHNSKIRYALLTPRAQYQLNQYVQSPFTVVELGTTPIYQTITNATTLDFSISAAEDEQFTVTIIGPTDRASEDREQIVFAVGDTSKESTKRFTDVVSITKSIFTKTDVVVRNSEGTEVAMIPNNYFEARNTIVQIADRCTTTLCTECKCFDFLYKKLAPVLYYDEQTIPDGYEEALMVKTLEWITLPKDGGEDKALVFADKTKAMMMINNEESGVGKSQRVDLGRNGFTSIYYGYL